MQGVVVDIEVLTDSWYSRLTGYAQGPAPVTSQADSWLGYQTHSWPLGTAHNAAHSVPVPIRSNVNGFTTFEGARGTDL